jgi:hypothetical protein
MENKTDIIKFNPDLESEAGKLYHQYCEEKGIECRITAAANFCLGYMAVKGNESALNAQQGGVWVKASEFKSTGYPVYRPYRRKRWKDEEHGYDYGEIYITEDNGDIFLDVDNAKEYEPQSFECWNDFEILDESSNAYQELKKKGDKMAEALKEILKQRDYYSVIELADKALNAWNGNGQKKEGEAANLGTCKECGTRKATTDYNGHQYYVCDPCSKRLNREFDNEYK